MNQIEEIAQRARTKTQPTQESIQRLRNERSELLHKGERLLLGGCSYEERERFINEYQAIVRRINEDQADLDARQAA